MEKPKIAVVMPAYNAGRTLRLTYADLPVDSVDLVILVDDGSSDDTLAVARQLGLEIFVHARNFGYGANQKTCYREALRAGADIIVMVHPDYQYDPTLLPQLVAPLAENRADVVLGSRLMGRSPLSQGMPWWKYIANRVLTFAENRAFRLRLSEYHTGYRAYSRAVLETVNFEMNSDRFIFDQEFIGQCVVNGYRITEVAVPTRYFPEASSASFTASCRYGLEILRVIAQFLLHKNGVLKNKRFDSLARRYSKG
jgi:glycosyltransferase involved in cell wall biosynthesis